MKYAIGMALSFVFILPLLVFVHELGHALPILLGGYEAHITLGSLEPSLSLNLFSLNISISPLSLVHGACNWSMDVPDIVKLIALLAGPFASLLVSITAFFRINTFSNYASAFIVRFVFSYSAFQFLGTISPINYSYFSYIGGEGYSDGYNALMIVIKLLS
jgi:hypothetical protein